MYDMVITIHSIQVCTTLNTLIFKSPNAWQLDVDRMCLQDKRNVVSRVVLDHLSPKPHKDIIKQLNLGSSGWVLIKYGPFME